MEHRRRDQVWPRAGRGVQVGRVAAGLGFLAAAAFNLTVTRREAPRVFARMHDDAWLLPWRWLLRRIVIPHGPAVVVGAAAYEAAVGICILGRGRLVTAGLLGGAVWAVVTTPLLPPAQAIGNFALAPALVALAQVRGPLGSARVAPAPPAADPHRSGRQSAFLPSDASRPTPGTKRPVADA